MQGSSSGRAATAAAVVLSLAGCASGPPPEHGPHMTAETVTVTEQGLLPGGDVQIPAFASVVFRNARSAGAIDIDLDRQLGACRSCSTMLNFEPDGEHAVARGLGPQGVATICFHEPGSFPFVVHSPQGDQRGTIVVGGGR